MTMRALLACLALSFALPAAAEGIQGRWQFQDAERSEGRRWTVEIAGIEAASSGRIVAVADASGTPVSVTCAACKGEDQNRALIGLEVFRNLRKQPDTEQWSGQWLDVASGRLADVAVAFKRETGRLAFRICKGMFCKRFEMTPG